MKISISFLLISNVCLNNEEFFPIFISSVSLFPHVSPLPFFLTLLPILHSFSILYLTTTTFLLIVMTSVSFSLEFLSLPIHFKRHLYSVKYHYHPSSRFLFLFFLLSAPSLSLSRTESVLHTLSLSILTERNSHPFQKQPFN